MQSSLKEKLNDKTFKHLMKSVLNGLEIKPLLGDLKGLQIEFVDILFLIIE